MFVLQRFNRTSVRFIRELVASGFVSHTVVLLTLHPTVKLPASIPYMLIFRKTFSGAPMVLKLVCEGWKYLYGLSIRWQIYDIISQPGCSFLQLLQPARGVIYCLCRSRPIFTSSSESTCELCFSVVTRGEDALISLCTGFKICLIGRNTKRSIGTAFK